MIYKDQFRIGNENIPKAIKDCMKEAYSKINSTHDLPIVLKTIESVGDEFYVFLQKKGKEDNSSLMFKIPWDDIRSFHRSTGFSPVYLIHKICNFYKFYKEKDFVYIP